MSVDIDEKDAAFFATGVPGNSFYTLMRMTMQSDDYGWSFRTIGGGTGTVAMVMSDRSIMAGGVLKLWQDTNSYGLVRLNQAGYVDPNFAYTNTLDLNVQHAVELADGSVLTIALNSNGSLYWSEARRWSRRGERDTNYEGTWASTFGTNSQVTAIAKAPGTNGFVAALRTEPTGGSGPGGPAFSKVVTLDEMGNITDWGTELPLIAGTVNAVGFEVVNSETAKGRGYDRLLLGGEFNFYGTNEVKNLVSVSKTGEYVWGFSANEGPSGPIHAVAVQLDGKVLIGGTFTNVSGVEAKGLARIHGSSASGATYLYWADREFRAFEKLGEGRIVMRRSGDVSEPLTVFLSCEHPKLGQLVNVPWAVEFAAGEGEATAAAGILNNLQRGPRETFEIFASVTNANVVPTRAQVDLVVADDETPGTLDPKVNYDWGIRNFRVQPDGKILLLARTNVLRLNVDGTLDSAFVTNAIRLSPDFPFPMFVQLELSSDGKIYVSGSFKTTNTYGINHIARLNQDGSWDTTFNPYLSGNGRGYPNDYVRMDLSPDGGIVYWIPTLVTFSGASSSQYLFKMSPNGLWNSTFASGFNDTLLNDGSLEHLPNGELFTATGGITKIRKIGTNGVLQTNFFVSNPSSAGRVYDLEAHGNKLLVAGSFTRLGTNNVSYIALLDSEDGTLDTSFAASVNAQVNVVQSHNGKIYITGDFTEVNGKERFRIARLNGDGSLDESFDPGLGPNRAPTILGFQIDGKLIVGNSFDRVDGADTGWIAALENDHSSGEVRLISRRIVLSETNLFVNFEFEREGGSAGQLSAAVETVDGSALAGRDYVWTSTNVIYADGEFGRKMVQVQLLADPNKTGAKTFALRVLTFGNSTEATVLLEDDESPLVSGTAIVTGGTNEVRDVAVGLEGFVYVAGDFTSVDGFSVTNLTRLHPDLTIDSDFALPALPKLSNGLYAPIDAVSVRTNGQIVFGGKFVQIDGKNWRYIAQANADGTFDEVFNDTHSAALGAGVTYPRELVLQLDEKVVVNYTSGVKRLNVNGSPDSSFPYDFSLSSITKTVVAPDGTIYMLRNSSGTPGTLLRMAPGNQAAQLMFTASYRLANGSVSSARIEALDIASDGSLLVGGDFTHLNNAQLSKMWAAPRLARILTNGWIVDTNFVPAAGITGFIPRHSVTAIKVLPNGETLIGGNFTEVQGVPQKTLALLGADGKLREYFDPLVEGAGIAEFEGTPDGGVVVRGTVTAVDGSPVGDVFKLSFPAPLPPVAEFLWPTNGAEVRVSDVQTFVSVHAYDPDGFLKSVVLELNGETVATNTAGNIPFALFLPSTGEHQLRVIATDERGLATTQTVTFRTVSIPMPGLITVTKSDAGIVIRYSGAGLQASSDLQNWREVHTGGGEYVTPATEVQQFFRAVN